MSYHKKERRLRSGCRWEMLHKKKKKKAGEGNVTVTVVGVE